MLYINITGNLTFDTTEDDLKKFFEDTSNHNVFEYKFLIFFLDSEPSSIRLITDKSTKKSKGFAFVEFTGSKYLEVSYPDV